MFKKRHPLRRTGTKAFGPLAYRPIVESLMTICWKIHKQTLDHCHWLSAAVREADSLHSFRRKLKTRLFTLCFNDWL